MRKLLTAALAAAVLTSGAAAAQDMKFFRIGSGAAGGTYFPMAGLIAQAISNPPGSRPCDKGGSCGVPGLVAIAQSSNGSVANATAIQAGQLESGFSQSDVTYWAYSGTGLFEGKPKMDKLRVIASLFPEHIHVVASKTGVNTIQDLKGKTVGIGLPASGAIVGSRIVLEAAGLKEKTDYTPEYLSSADSINHIRDNQAQAMLTVTGYPQAAVVELTSTVGGKIVPVDGPLRDKILAENKFFAKGVIPSGTYKGQDADVQTVVVAALWITSADQPDELVYEITKGLWNDSTRKLLDSGHAKGKDITKETALDGVSIPLHPGAERFYREAGLLK